VANKFITSWERARGLLKPSDPDSDLPYSPGLVIIASSTGTGAGSADSDRTQITQYDFALALDNPMSACPTLAPGIVGAVATPLALSLPTQPSFLGADLLPPLYIARTIIVPSNPGLGIITAVDLAVATVQTIILSAFLGAIPPSPTLTPIVTTAWVGGVFGGIVNLFDAAMIRYITGAFSGGEGSPSDPPDVSGLPSVPLTAILGVSQTGGRDVIFTNNSVEPGSDPGLAWIVKTDDTVTPTVTIGGPGSTALFTYDAAPPGPVTFTPSIVGGNKAGTSESPTVDVTFVI